MRRLYWCWFFCACAAIQVFFWFAAAQAGRTNYVAPLFCAHGLVSATVYLVLDIRAGNDRRALMRRLRAGS